MPPLELVDRSERLWPITRCKIVEAVCENGFDVVQAAGGGWQVGSDDLDGRPSRSKR